MQALLAPAFAPQNTPSTNDLTNDGYTWANNPPICVDKYGNLITWCQRLNSGTHLQVPNISSNNGITWSMPTLTNMNGSAAGAWSGVTAYVVGNTVSLSGVTYTCILGNTNQIPPNTTYWSVGVGEGFLVRGAWAYDPVNDIQHLLWTDESTLVLYRRYTFTRDGSHHITGITRDTTVNLVLDPASGTFFYGFPSILWIPEGGTFGSVLCGWCAANETPAAWNSGTAYVIGDNVSSGGTAYHCILGNTNNVPPNATYWTVAKRMEQRLTMRALTNDANDQTAGNWKAPVTAATNTLGNAAAPSVAYSALVASVGNVTGPITLYRKVAGSNIKDIYAAWYDLGANTSTAAFFFSRLQWNSASNDWSNGQTAAQQLSLIIISGTDNGYSLKGQLLTKWAEDTDNDRLYIGFPIWKDNANGDTISYVSVNAAAGDAISARVDPYSALGAHSFAPTIDLMYDSYANLLVVAYIQTSTQFAFARTYDGISLMQTDTLITTAVDIPLLNDVRVANKLAALFRNAAGSAPYTGYFGTLTWYDPAPPRGSHRPAPFAPGAARSR